MMATTTSSSPAKAQPVSSAADTERFRLLFDSVSDMAVIIAREGDGGYRCLAANQAVSRMEGIPLAAIVGMRIDVIHPPAAYAEWKDIYDRTLETGGPLVVDHEVESPLGPRKRRTRFQVMPPDGTGRELLLGVCQDLTDAFKAESERVDFDRYRKAMKRLNDVLDGDRPEEMVLQECVEVVRETFGTDRCFLSYPCNPEAEAVTIPFYTERPGSRIAALSQDLYGYIAGARLPDRIRQAARNRSSWAARTPRESAPMSWKRTRSMPDWSCPSGPRRAESGASTCIAAHRAAHGPHRTRSSYLDMAARIKSCLESLSMTGALRKSDAFHNLLTERIPQLLWTSNGRGKVHFANRRMLEFTGIEDAASLGGAMPHIHPEDLAKEYATWREMVGAGRPHEGEMRIRRKDGTWVWHLVRAEPLLDEAGKLELVVGTCTDISEGKRLQEDLLRSREQMATILAGITDSIIAQEPDGRIVYANEAAAKLLGFDSAAALIAAADRARETGAPSTMALFDEDGQALAIEKIPSRLARQGITPPPALLRFRMSPKAKERWVIAQAKPIFNAEGKVTLVIGMSQDITELKEKEEAVRRLQKMESLGKLAGGIAHDFNNLLVTINGYSDMGSKMTEDIDPQLHEFFEEIHKSGQRAASLTQQLLAYSRKQIVQPKTLDLNALVEDMRKLLSRLIGEDIQIETGLSAGLPAFKADPSQMEQVLMNLIVNARDAMPKGGVMRIETGAVLCEGAYLKNRPEARPGLHVFLRVTDTGMGMEPAVMERIFEPFFTTKPVGKGTGLGLASVYGIVDQSGGHITVESRVGSGSTFTILLPAFSEGSAASEGAPTPQSAEAGVRGTILLVEDEDSVLKFTRRVLEEKGYRVIPAKDGREAMDKAESLTSIDLLITDVVMPRMRGPDLSRALRGKLPELKVLMMSGYIDPDGMEGEEAGRSEFIQKPFGMDVILARVGALLRN